MEANKKNNPSFKKPLKSYNTFLKFSTAAIQMGVIITVFAYLGKYLDEKTHYYPHLFTIIFSLIGIGGGLYIVIREVIAMSKQDKNDDNN